jgi:hypothetical protein
MLARDPYSGMLHEVPDLAEYDVGEVVYDGFGNPVAIAPPGLAFTDGLGGTLGLPFLLPLLPAIAGAASAALPAVTGLISSLGPKSAPAPPPPMPPAPAAPPPAFAPTAPPVPWASRPGGMPSPQGPIVIRRYRRRSAHAR